MLAQSRSDSRWLQRPFLPEQLDYLPAFRAERQLGTFAGKRPADGIIIIHEADSVCFFFLLTALAVQNAFAIVPSRKRPNGICCRCGATGARDTVNTVTSLLAQMMNSEDGSLV